jgi:hypothetical protein
VGTVQDGQFLSLAEAQRELGMTPATFKRRRRRHDVPTYRHPADERRLLVRRDDLRAILQPRRAHATAAKGVAA